MKWFEWSGWPCWKLHRLNNPMNNSFSLHLLDCSDKSWAGWQILLWFREILLRAFQCPSGCCFCGTNLHFMKQRTTGTNRHIVKEVGAWITRRPNYNSICHSRHPILLGFMHRQRPYRYRLLLLSLLCVFMRGFPFPRLASVTICNNCWKIQFSYKLSWGPWRGRSSQSTCGHKDPAG